MRTPFVTIVLIQLLGTFRHQWPETWGIISQFLATVHPNWDGLEVALQKHILACQSNKMPHNNGNFRKMHAINVFLNDKWVVCSGASWKRDVMVMKAGWQACSNCRTDLRKYIQNPNSLTFSNFYDTFKAELASCIHGCMGDYTFKRLLDVIIVSGLISRAHVSRWPADCTGYQSMLKQLFPSISAKKDKEEALFRFFG